MKSINEYINALILSRRYDILNEGFFGKKNDKKKNSSQDTNKKEYKYIGSINKYSTGETDPKSRTFPYNTIEDAAYSIVEALVSNDYCDNGYITIDNKNELNRICYLYKVDVSSNYKIISLEFTGTCKECIEKYKIPIKSKAIKSDKKNRDRILSDGSY